MCDDNDFIPAHVWFTILHYIFFNLTGHASHSVYVHKLLQ